MDAVEYLRERNRMCESITDEKTFCGNCELHKAKCCYTHKTKEQAKKAVEIVERWSKEHPRKTRASEFLKVYPNADFSVIDGYPNLNPCMFDTSLRKASRCNEGCANCRRKYWSEEVK